MERKEKPSRKDLKQEGRKAIIAIAAFLEVDDRLLEAVLLDLLVAKVKKGGK